MNIDKDTILNLLRSNGQDTQADRAQQELPDQVDTDQHAGLLEKFGLNPADLIAQVHRRPNRGRDRRPARQDRLTGPSRDTRRGRGAGLQPLPVHKLATGRATRPSAHLIHRRPTRTARKG